MDLESLLRSINQDQQHKNKQKEQFFNFIKLILHQLYQPIPSLHSLPIYLCLKNQNKKPYEIKQIPQQTIAFMKQQTQAISQSRITDISFFIDPSTNIFESKESMNQFLSQTIRVKSFFILLFNWITKSSLSKTQQTDSSSNRFIQWVQQSTPEPGQQSTPEPGQQPTPEPGQQPTPEPAKLTINQPEKLNKKLEEAANFWKFIIQNQIFKSQLQKYSLMFTHPNCQGNYPDQKDPHFFTKLYERIFVNHQNFGWNQLFKLKPIFYSIAKFRSTKSSQTQSFGFQAQYFQKRLKQKTKILKMAFIYLHKYFMAKDFIILGLRNAGQQKEYAKKLPFQAYVPSKLGLSLQVSLEYQEWFEVFYIEHNDKRPGVVKAASELYNILEQEGGKMLKTVKRFERCHLSRLMYILSEKLQFQKYSSLNCQLTNQFLKRQVSNFIKSNRVYEILFTQIKQILDQELIKLKTPLNSQKTAQFIINTYKSMAIDDMLPLLMGYLKILTEKEQSSANLLESTFQTMNKDYKITDKLIIANLNRIKANAQIKNDFLHFLRTIKTITS